MSRTQEERWRRRHRAQWLPPNYQSSLPWEEKCGEAERGQDELTSLHVGTLGIRVISILKRFITGKLLTISAPKIPQYFFFFFFGSLFPLCLPMIPVVNQKWDSIFDTPNTSYSSIRDLLGQAEGIFAPKVPEMGQYRTLCSSWPFCSQDRNCRFSSISSNRLRSISKPHWPT